MACDTRLKPRQTISERAKEVRESIERLAIALATGKVRAIVDRRTRALTFAGWEGSSRDGITDACVYRLALRTGDTRILAAVARAEAMAGITVSKEAVNAGIHSHDGGKTWHGH